VKAVLLGILASFFFASSFILNRSMALAGGSWAWSASLRYFFMLPFLLIIVGIRGNMRTLYSEMRAHFKSWLLWSTIGFGLFYAPMTFAAAYGPGWLIAATWQVTIIAGTLLVPFLPTSIPEARGTLVREKVPLKSLLLSLIILLGVVVMQVDHGTHFSWQSTIVGTVPVLLAAFAYPLGNRQMMNLCQNCLDVFQRVLGMTLASLPFWLLLALFGFTTTGLPSRGQVLQSGIVAISSGIIATLLFFRATDMAKGDVSKLSAIEATQAGEVVFTVLGEWLLLSSPLPSVVSWLGIGLVILGLFCHSYFSHGKQAFPERKTEVPSSA
jgi:drug/metabolite transporter (DMT)-like permease